MCSAFCCSLKPQCTGEVGKKSLSDFISKRASTINGPNYPPNYYCYATYITCKTFFRMNWSKLNHKIKKTVVKFLVRRQDFASFLDQTACQTDPTSPLCTSGAIQATTDRGVIQKLQYIHITLKYVLMLYIYIFSTIAYLCLWFVLGRARRPRLDDSRMQTQNVDLLSRSWRVPGIVYTKVL